jgi:hypothetical protein
VFAGVSVSNGRHGRHGRTRPSSATSSRAGSRQRRGDSDEHSKIESPPCAPSRPTSPHRNATTRIRGAIYPTRASSPPVMTDQQRTCERKTEFPLEVAKRKISLAKTPVCVDATSASAMT